MGNVIFIYRVCLYKNQAENAYCVINKSLMPTNRALSLSNSIRDIMKTDFHRTEGSIWNMVS